MEKKIQRQGFGQGDLQKDFEDRRRSDRKCRPEISLRWRIERQLFLDGFRSL